MERIKYINDTKYVLNEKYYDFYIYDEVCPTGLKVKQSYMFTNNDMTIVCNSYNHKIREEILDIIDNYIDNKIFGIKAINKGKYFVMHDGGKLI